MKNSTGTPKDPRLVELDAHYARLQAQLEAEGHDGSVPGAAADGHLVVHAESNRGFGSALTRCTSRQNAA